MGGNGFFFFVLNNFAIPNYKFRDCGNDVQLVVCINPFCYIFEVNVERVFLSN